MPFGLKNVGATYPCLVNKMFAPLIVKNIEVYVNDMLVKRKKMSYHVDDLAEAIGVSWRYKININSKKFSSRVASGKFLASWPTKEESKQI